MTQLEPKDITAEGQASTSTQGAREGPKPGSERPGDKGSGGFCVPPGPHVLHGLSYINLLIVVQSKEF